MLDKTWKINTEILLQKKTRQRYHWLLSVLQSMEYLNRLIQAYGWHVTEAEILQSCLSDWRWSWLNDIYVPGDWSHRPYIVFSGVMFNCDQSRHVKIADTGKTLKHVKLVMTYYRCRSTDIQCYRLHEGL